MSPYGEEVRLNQGSEQLNKLAPRYPVMQPMLPNEVPKVNHGSFQTV
jgi:hypothetical protein